MVLHYNFVLRLFNSRNLGPTKSLFSKIFVLRKIPTLWLYDQYT